MKYHYVKPNLHTAMYGELYLCNHPLYDRCTLYKMNGKGLSVIQQYSTHKHTYWDAIQPDLIDQLYLQDKFPEFFNKYAGPCINGLYPTVTIRQIMWALRMKPLPKERWETTFDHKPI